MRILGVDPALAITGYGVIDFNKKNASLVEAGIIKTSAQNPLPQRLDKLYQGIIDLIGDTKPDVLVLEKLYVHHHHPTTAYILGEARGVICLAAAKADLVMAEYSATRIKKAITGQGLASKNQVQRMVVSFLGLKTLPQYNDVTDALAMAIAHANMMRF